MTGLPRSSGRSRCSTAAKNASRSTCRIVRSLTGADSPPAERQRGGRIGRLHTADRAAARRGTHDLWQSIRAPFRSRTRPVPTRRDCMHSEPPPANDEPFRKRLRDYLGSTYGAVYLDWLLARPRLLDWALIPGSSGCWRGTPSRGSTTARSRTWTTSSRWPTRSSTASSGLASGPSWLNELIPAATASSTSSTRRCRPWWCCCRSSHLRPGFHQEWASFFLGAVRPSR